ncbi:hypothetical protein [Gordonia sp. SL306]|uniref:hypothetical protein n=1 Tax=Gordonia sp. SL306 TaxID=2995145 RepID=UPI00226E1D92|nr:hypothetical protein [Gordonia sp. SL306]WAC53804.1 hypothetical protein OVA31_13905 [Gordonia sp. SL306]
MSWLTRVLDTQHNYLLRAVSGLAPEAAHATALCAGPDCSCGAVIPAHGEAW